VPSVESEPAVDLDDDTAPQPQPPPAPAKPEDDSLLKKAIEVLMKAPTQ
jgi:hypothetical protein